MAIKITKIRGEAYSGNGYGTMRRMLQEHARDHVERSIAGGFYCEAIAICESVIADRLESRLAYLAQKSGLGFMTLGGLIRDILKYETDAEMLSIIKEADEWRVCRNEALHELVKVEAKIHNLQWSERMEVLKLSALNGYKLLKRLYHRVADLNPNHIDRVFSKH